MLKRAVILGSPLVILPVFLQQGFFLGDPVSAQLHDIVFASFVLRGLIVPPSQSGQQLFLILQLLLREGMLPLDGEVVFMEIAVEEFPGLVLLQYDGLADRING